MVETRNAALENIQIAQARQANAYNRRNNVQAIAIEVGTLVMKYRASRVARSGDSLKSPWTGPYEIVDASDNGKYRIKNSSTGRVM
jgi:hypothetical protein